MMLLSWVLEVAIAPQLDPPLLASMHNTGLLRRMLGNNDWKST